MSFVPHYAIHTYHHNTHNLQQRIQDFLGVQISKSAGLATYYLGKFDRKLHENDENWTEEGTRVQKFIMYTHH